MQSVGLRQRLAVDPPLGTTQQTWPEEQSDGSSQKNFLLLHASLEPMHIPVLVGSELQQTFVDDEQVVVPHLTSALVLALKGH